MNRFKCGACGLFRDVTGRKMRHVHGLRTFVCPACNDKMAPMLKQNVTRPKPPVDTK